MAFRRLPCSSALVADVVTSTSAAAGFQRTQSQFSATGEAAVVSRWMSVGSVLRLPPLWRYRRQMVDPPYSAINVPLGIPARASCLPDNLDRFGVRGSSSSGTCLHGHTHLSREGRCVVSHVGGYRGVAVALGAQGDDLRAVACCACRKVLDRELHAAPAAAAAMATTERAARFECPASWPIHSSDGLRAFSKVHRRPCGPSGDVRVRTAPPRPAAPGRQL